MLSENQLLLIYQTNKAYTGPCTQPSRGTWVNYFCRLFLTLTTSDISLSSVLDVTLFDRGQARRGNTKASGGEVSRSPRHKSDPHRNVVLTLMVQSKGQSDVTGI